MSKLTVEASKHIRIGWLKIDESEYGLIWFEIQLWVTRQLNAHCNCIHECEWTYISRLLASEFATIACEVQLVRRHLQINVHRTFTQNVAD